MRIVLPQRTCLYCGQPTKRGKKGEHIVQETLGGALTLRDVSDRVVCPKCNNGFLSEIDKELCSRSYLSTIASQQLDAHLWQAWDVDHEANNLLVEARPSWAADETLNSLVCYPQITFERKGPDVRGDGEEAEHFGCEDFAKVLFKAVRRCFGRYCAGEKGALHFERIESGVVYQGYRLAPRIFTRHSIFEIARNISDQTFILRFVNEEDKRFALCSLSKLDEGQKITGWSRKSGSHYPTISCFFDIAKTLRALMKIGLNLVAAYCPNTPVNRESFERAIRIIRGEMQMLPPAFHHNGFVHAEDIERIKGADKEHSFRLVHTGQAWHVYSSFFGGRIGTYVQVPGPNYERWKCADILAPIRSNSWRFKEMPILEPFNVRVAWGGANNISPSLRLLNSVASGRIEVERKRRPRHASSA
jgi:hypothetical protein